MKAAPVSTPNAAPTTIHHAVGKNNKRWATTAGLAGAVFVDRAEDNAINILWPTMYPALGLTVGQLGPVLGISKLVMTLMLPIWGYAVDRLSRKVLLVWFTGFWGVWTLAIGLIDSYSQLLTVRLLSSLGLGLFGPAAFSLLADLFEPEQRGRAAGVIEGLSLLGLLASFIGLPLLAASNPEVWRMAFLIIGGASVASGIVMAFSIEEPPRKASAQALPRIVSHKTTIGVEQTSTNVELGERSDEKSDMPGSYRLTMADMRRLMRVPSWRWLLTKDVLDAVSFGTFVGWVVTWLSELGLDERVYIVLTLIILGSIIGHVTSGWLSDLLERRYPQRGRVMLVFVGLLIMFPSIFAFIIVGIRNLPLLIAIGFVFGFAHSATAEGASWPIGQAVLPPELHGRGRGVINMCMGGAGALALTLSGWVADQVGVQSMLYLLIPWPILLSLLLWLPMFRSYAQDREQSPNDEG